MFIIVKMCFPVISWFQIYSKPHAPTISMESSKLSRVRGIKNSYSQLNDDEEEKETLLGRDTIVLGNLHPKKRGDWSPARSPKDQTIECDIQPSDTLQTLALKVSIAGPAARNYPNCSLATFGSEYYNILFCCSISLPLQQYLILIYISVQYPLGWAETCQ